ncbi:PR-1-like protein [Schizophyllum amplum]|uniref:PR-1-like protein n=1 Tax=Schizophyllum amplum TaxID=97359 RepID=A0A550CTU3_9AGAR|nr:PR-1-like protein [Auriculariopsis ampla]
MSPSTLLSTLAIILLTFSSFAAAYPTYAQILEYLDTHDSIRAQHDAAALDWSDTLAIMAQEYANTCQMASSGGALLDTLYGENIVAGTDDFTPVDAVNAFASDESQYSVTAPVYNHWTQVVWKSTSEVGCAVSSCNDLLGQGTGVARLHVCLYSEPGNVVGQALENVQP